MTIQQLGIEDHETYEGSVEEINKIPARDAQKFTFDELNTLLAKVNELVAAFNASTDKLQDLYMRITLEPNRAANVAPTPQDLYSLASIAAGTRIQIQNQSHDMLHVFSGPAAPADTENYFAMKPFQWMTFESDVLLAYSDIIGAAVVVQEGTDQISGS